MLYFNKDKHKLMQGLKALDSVLTYTSYMSVL